MTFFENFYSNKLENLKEFNKFLDTYELPELSQDDIKSLNSLITGNKIALIKSLTNKKN